MHRRDSLKSGVPNTAGWSRQGMVEQAKILSLGVKGDPEMDHPWLGDSLMWGQQYGGNCEEGSRPHGRVCAELPSSHRFQRKGRFLTM